LLKTANLVSDDSSDIFLRQVVFCRDLQLWEWFQFLDGSLETVILRVCIEVEVATVVVEITQRRLGNRGAISGFSVGGAPFDAFEDRPDCQDLVCVDLEVAILDREANWWSAGPLASSLCGVDAGLDPPELLFVLGV
jgi:hypothetical protein